MESCDLMKNFLLETSLTIVYSILKGVVRHWRSSFGLVKGVVKHWRSSFGLWVLTQLWMVLYSKHIYFVLGIGFAGFLHWTRMNEDTARSCLLITAQLTSGFFDFQTKSFVIFRRPATPGTQRVRVRFHCYLIQGAEFYESSSRIGIYYTNETCDQCEPHWKCKVNKNDIMMLLCNGWEL